MSSQICSFRVSPRYWLGGAILAIAFALYLSPLPVTEDWINLHDASWRLLLGQQLYAQGYVNPPHIAVLLLPLTVWPIRVGFSILNAATLGILTLLAVRLRLSIIQTVVLLLSPPVLYTVLHGQIDVLILSVLFLPRSLWIIAAIGKPQVAGGLFLRTGLRGWILGGLVIAATFVLYPGWVQDLLAEAQGAISGGWNVLRGFWPQQLAIAAGLLVQGYRRNDDLMNIAASPFLLPYAALSSFIGLWLLVCAKMRTDGLLAIWVVWWVAIVWRMIT